jgi:hypothetical protein
MFYRLLHHTGNELEQTSVSFHYMACGLCHLCGVAGLFFPNPALPLRQRLLGVEDHARSRWKVMTCITQ